ncbi:MAG: type I-E CRISPR-associated protein Cas7/Cse4/CasC [Aerococcus sp.]|nr:type I-E CRISPR-associated protein Cas7/Cse4/CasC [Aerococcus sp.]
MVKENNNRLFVEVHALQSVPPSCINRDDMGSPKTALYGGATRARVSSQSWKHAMRVMFTEEFPEEQLGVRTKKLEDIVKNRLEEGDNSESQLYLKIIKKVIPDNNVLMFIGKTAIDELVNKYSDIMDKYNSYLNDMTKKKAQEKAAEEIVKVIKSNGSIDISLFGRMVANTPQLNVDACAQVAHAISTHAVENQFDYFTALDDVMDSDNAGAAHLDTAEFNSSTLYRYTTVAIHDFNSKIKSIDSIDLGYIVKKYVEAFIKSMPTGKQNSYANRTLPSTVLVTFRTDQPINLVGAFEKPVVSDRGYMEESVERLANQYKNYSSMFGSPEKSLLLSQSSNEKFDQVTDVENFDKLLDAVENEIQIFAGERVM